MRMQRVFQAYPSTTTVFPFLSLAVGIPSGILSGISHSLNPNLNSEPQQRNYSHPNIDFSSKPPLICVKWNRRTTRIHQWQKIRSQIGLSNNQLGPYLKMYREKHRRNKYNKKYI